MKRTTNIKQHYVPQFYLRNFASDSEKINVFDVHRENSYVTSPAKECYVKYFYDVEIEYLKLFTSSPDLTIEMVDDSIRIHNENVSASTLHFLKEIRNCDESFNFPINERENLYNFITLQMIRTPEYGSRLAYLNLPFTIKTGLSGELGDEKTLDLVHNLLILGVVERLHNADYKLNELYYNIFGHLIDQILDLKLQLQKAGKLFLLNKSEDEFIASSSPINMWWKNNPIAQTKALVTTFNPEEALFDIGKKMAFRTVFLPISTDVGIFFFDLLYNKELTAMNQSIGVIDESNVDLLVNLNLSTYLKCSHKIYSRSGKYDVIKELKRDKQNPRFEFRFSTLT